MYGVVLQVNNKSCLKQFTQEAENYWQIDIV